MIRHYRIIVTETAEAEADAIFLWMNRTSPDRAIRWYHGLLSAYESLSEFPYRFETLPDRQDLRRLLYGKYRVIYSVKEPALATDEPVVRIMHIYHGAHG